jgi:hypothetical protein
MCMQLEFVNVCAQVLSCVTRNLQHVYRSGKVLHDESPNASVFCDNVASSSVDVMKWHSM